MAHPDPYSQITLPESRQSAADRMLEVYTIAIDANAAGDRETVAHSLALLKRTLEPEADLLLARQLFDLYEQAEAALTADKPDITAEILETLRGLWTAKLRLEQLKKT